MKKISILLLSVLMAASCSKDNYTACDDGQIRFTAVYPGVTKASSLGFEDGDSISLYAVEYEGGASMPLQVTGNYLNNEKVTHEGSSWVSSRPLYWSDVACDFYALYPYQQTISSVEKYPFSVATDQNDDGYEKSDLLYALAENVGQSSGTVKLNFKHIMSKLTVVMTKGSKFKGEIPDDIVTHIYNTNLDCSVNLTAGSVEKDAFGSRKTITMKKISNERFEAVVVPQNLEKKTPLVEITMGGIAYLLEYSLSFRPGYAYTINVTLNTSPEQEQIEISIDPSKDDWN